MSRETFEAWVTSKWDSRLLREWSEQEQQRIGDGYAGETLNKMWMAWQAATASMQAERDQLAAECAALKEYISEKCYIVDPKADLTANADIPAEDFQPQTPAADRFLAEQRAQGVEMFAAHIGDLANSMSAATAEKMKSIGRQGLKFAAQLRNEVKV